MKTAEIQTMRQIKEINIIMEKLKNEINFAEIQVMG